MLEQKKTVKRYCFAEMSIICSFQLSLICSGFCHYYFAIIIYSHCRGAAALAESMQSYMTAIGYQDLFQQMFCRSCIQDIGNILNDCLQYCCSISGRNCQHTPCRKHQISGKFETRYLPSILSHGFSERPPNDIACSFFFYS